jgi:hypothetical protein
MMLAMRLDLIVWARCVVLKRRVEQVTGPPLAVELAAAKISIHRGFEASLVQ